MKLTIIIPYYNAEPYTSELLGILAPQITKDVECIVVDDGSVPAFQTEHEWVQVYSKANGGPATARNKGIELAKGEYISFIDADDTVPEYYVEKILDVIDKSHADVINFSWKSYDHKGKQYNYRLNTEEDHLPNPSVCTRCFKRSFIGDVRFNEKKDATEDEDFSRKLGYLEKGSVKQYAITDYMYYYRTFVPNSNVKNFKAGLTRTKRIIYHYPEVTTDMRWLLKEIKKDDEVNEVILMTDKCDIPELKRYCTIEKTTCRTWGHELKGEQNRNVNIIPPPVQCQVVLYADHMDLIGGIPTFVCNFTQLMKDYDITYVVNKAPKEHIEYMKKYMRVVVGPDVKVICDTLIMLRLADSIPDNITFNKTIQMCHACKFRESLHIPQERDYIVNVSEASKDSFKAEALDSTVIHNLIAPEHKKPLILMSATRLPAIDKGDSEKRMRQLADMLNAAKIDFIWLNFSDGQMVDPPKNFFNMGHKMNVSKYFGMASYVVQLSNNEAWSYTILEALTQNVPVLVCPFDSAYEMGVEDGVNGYILPFDMKFSIKKLLRVPKFNFKYDNDVIIDQWKQLIDSKAPEKKTVKVMVMFKKYYDVKLRKELREGDIVEMLEDRAIYLQNEKGLVKII